jgi:hypothetical protein
MGNLMLAPGRHDRGWPRMSLLCWTRRSPQTFRFFIEVMGRCDAHDARGSSYEAIEWLRSLTPEESAVLADLERERRPRAPEEPE